MTTENKKLTFGDIVYIIYNGKPMRCVIVGIERDIKPGCSFSLDGYKKIMNPKYTLYNIKVDTPQFDTKEEDLKYSIPANANKIIVHHNDVFRTLDELLECFRKELI